MRPIVTSIDIPAPPEQVWDALAAIGTHSNWMADAESIVFLTEQESGKGTRIRVRTRVGPIQINDDMEFIDWEPHHRMAVRHIGRIGGRGEFLLSATATGSRFTWEESLRFPWYLGGPLVLTVARPVLRRIFAANLERFAATVT